MPQLQKKTFTDHAPFISKLCRRTWASVALEAVASMVFWFEDFSARHSKRSNANSVNKPEFIPDIKLINEIVAYILGGILTLCFFVSALRLAASRSYWMDEVLAIWTSRLPDMQTIMEALNKGSEFSPPLYHFMLHRLMAAGFDSPLSLRVPSIIAVYSVGICAYILLRRRYSSIIAVLGMAFCLSGILFPFALQVRQNAMVTACFALAVLTWDISGDVKPSRRRAATLFLLLAAAIGMHFYALLLGVAMGAMEVLWSVVHRRVRWPFLAAIILAGLSILLWWPIMQHASAFNNGDTSAPLFYGQPLLKKLPSAYRQLLRGHEGFFFVLSGVILLIGLIRLLMNSIFGNSNTGVMAPNLKIIISISCAIPVGVFLFSTMITHAFSIRYVIAGSFGLSLFSAHIMSTLPFCRVLSSALIALIISNAFDPPVEQGPGQPDAALALVNQAPLNLPLVTGNGLRFLELREQANPAVASRLIYLKSPAATLSPDPTNEHQVERWATIDPNVVVKSLDAFLQTNQTFMVFSDLSSTDLLPGLLLERGYVLDPIVRAGNGVLAVARKASMTTNRKEAVEPHAKFE